MSQLVDQHGQPFAHSLTYEGANHSRERTYRPVVVADSSDTITPWTRTQSMGWARLLGANVGVVGGAVSDLARYSVGQGLRPLSQTSDPETALAYEDYFADWELIADVTGNLTLGEMQAVVSEGVDYDGDIGSLFINDGPGYLQLIRGHRIGNDKEAEKAGFIDGVKRNGYGRSVAYRVKTGKAWTTYDNSEFALILEAKAPDQVRGITSLAHALAHLRDLLDIVAYEKVGVKMLSAIGVAITTESGLADVGQQIIEPGNTAADTGTVATETWQAGMIPRLKRGESIELIAGSRPASTFAGFIEFLIRDTAVGLGLPFEFVWDPAKVGGSGNRFVLAKAQRRFEQRQKVLQARWLNRVWTWVIGRAIDAGKVPFSTDFHRVAWQPPAKITVDSGREATANRDDIKFGNRTLAEDAGERGLHWMRQVRVQKQIEVRDLLKRARELIAENPELTLQEACQLLSQSSASPPAPVKPATPPPGPEENKSEEGA